MIDAAIVESAAREAHLTAMTNGDRQQTRAGDGGLR